MPETIIYIHGFLSSPQSYKAQALGDWLAVEYPDIRYLCPALSPYPEATRHTLIQMVEQAAGRIYLIGSSLGGYWASYLAERYDLPAVLINPSVAPDKMMPHYLEQTLKNYSSEDTYWLEPHHIEEIKACDTPSIQRTANYWLLAQKGDEVLDYRTMVSKYRGCRQTVEDGGDHSFQGFERFLPEIVQFYRDFASQK